jgi:parallel beta-helix repeat protein
VQASVSHGQIPIGVGNTTTDEDAAGAPYDDGLFGDFEVIWSPFYNPHYIEENYTVEMGWNLIIQPGCDIRFENGTRLIVHGMLTADGADVGINFTSNQTTKNPGDWDGIYIDGGSLITMNNCELEYSTNGVFLSNWGMFGMGIQNSAIHHILNYGVYLDFVMGGPMITSSDIYNCSYGVYSLSSSLLLTGNNIYNNTNGVYLAVKTGLSPFSPWVSQNNITYNQINGIFVNGEAPGIDNNYISYNGRNGIYMTNESWDGPIYSTFQNNKLENNSVAGIWLDSMDPNIIRNTILNGTYGIYLNSSHINIYESHIRNWNTAGIVAQGTNSSFVWVENSTMSSAFGDCFYIDDDSHIITMNTTFDKAKVNIQDLQSNLTVNWWIHIRVNETDGDPAVNAQVWLNDTFGDNLLSEITDSLGGIYWVNVTEYVEGFGAINFNTHNATALNNSEIGFNNVDIESFMIIYIDIGDFESFQITLQKGWNMISAPLNQTDWQLSKVLKSIDGKYSAVQWYNITDPLDSWKHNKVGKLFGNDLLEINNRMGFWIYMDSQEILNVKGYIPLNINISLYTGWNFVGYPSLDTNDLAFALSSIAGKYDAVYHYNATDSLDPWKSDIKADLNFMRPGEGYWIHATEDCLWIL